MGIRAISPNNAALRAASQRSSGRRLNGSVLHKIGFDIVSGTYPPGTLLADEVAFAEELEISRDAYREAMRVLAAKGLIESRPRARTKVLARDRWNILDRDILAWAFSAEPDLGLIQDLFELRQIIEPAAASLAARRRTTAHLKTLENALRSMRENGAHCLTGRAADREFHRTILGATGNTALMNLGAGIAAAVDWTARYKQRSLVIARDAVPDHARVYDAMLPAMELRRTRACVFWSNSRSPTPGPLSLHAASINSPIGAGRPRKATAARARHSGRTKGEVPTMRLRSCKHRRFTLLGAASLLFSSGPGVADDPRPDPLAQQFQDPPQTARPRVWWHWLNGNVSKDGIAKDIGWMKEVGIGGIQTFDTSLATTRVVDKPLRYMSPEWKEAFRLAASLAAENDLEFGIATSPGFSETGGPWVTAADAMKKLVWSDITLPGRRHFAGKLPLPPTAAGPYQSIASPDAAGLARAGRAPDPFYADIAVLAYPTSSGSDPADPATITSLAGEPVDRALLGDGLYKDGLRLETGTAENPGGLRVAFPAPRTIRSATMFIPGKSALFDIPLAPRLEARMDGAAWLAVAEVPIAAVPTTVSFAPVTAREFRLVLRPGPSLAMNQNAPATGAVGAELLAGGTPRVPKTVNVAEFFISGAAKVDRFETKAAFATSKDYYALDRDALPDAAGIEPARIIDLTNRLKVDGSLDWTPPAGRWRVLRLGYSLTGATNHPAPPEATGLEVDKFDGAAVRRYMEHYLDLYRDAVGPGLFGARGVNALLNDSIESGDANWTANMIAQFKGLRGYDPTLWLPALTGEIVVSRGKTDAFLYDFRRTIADLIAEQHYATIATIAHENGLRSYMESLEGGRSQIGDDMAMRAKADVPMAAMWAFSADRGPKPGYIADIKGAASLAHFFGQNVVAAESFTSLLRPWADAPRDLKRTIDLEFVTGVNLPAIHTSVHQPVEAKPGLPFHIIGQYFNRLDSWAPMARPWIDYIARSSFLLQQGRNVADVAYFYGEEAPVAGLFGDGPAKDAPTEWGYDLVNAGMLAQLRVENGRLLAPGGASYRALYLGGSSARMTLPTLKLLDRLREGGAAIVGDPPLSSPALRDDPAEFTALAGKLWGPDAINAAGNRILPRGSIRAAMQVLGETPDFAFSGGSDDSAVPFLHRHLADGDIYFLANLREHPETIEARFRVTGKAPELWEAETGLRTPLSYRIEGDHTVVPLTLNGGDAQFVVFRRAAGGTERVIARTASSPLARIGGPWTIAFQADRGAPPTAKLKQLASLADSADPAIRYFSGITTYTRKFALPKSVNPGEPLLLDLGAVGDLAEVRVNGQLVGALWHAPFRVEIGQATKRGQNALEVRVANLWVNRLIGDARKEGPRITSTSRPVYKPDTPLRPSGLIGPVRLLSSPPQP